MEIILALFTSGIVQWAKKRYGTNEYATLAFLGTVALLAAFMFQFLVGIGYWPLVAKILVTAGAFYAYILKRFE